MGVFKDAQLAHSMTKPHNLQQLAKPLYKLVGFSNYPRGKAEQLLPVNVSSDANELIDYLGSQGKSLRLPKIITFNKDQTELGFTIELICSLSKNDFRKLPRQFKKKDEELFEQYPNYFYKKEGELKSPYFKKQGKYWKRYCIEIKPSTSSGQVHKEFDALYLRFHPRQCRIIFVNTLPKFKPAGDKANVLYVVLAQEQLQLHYAIWDEGQKKWFRNTLALGKLLSNLYQMKPSQLKKTLQARVNELIKMIEETTPEAQNILVHDNLGFIGGGNSFEFEKAEQGYKIKLSQKMDLYTSGTINPLWLRFPAQFNCTHSEFLLIHRYFDDFTKQNSYIKNHLLRDEIFPSRFDEEYTWWLTRRLPYFVAKHFQDSFLNFLKNKGFVDQQSIVDYQAELQQDLELIERLAQNSLSQPVPGEHYRLKERFSLEFAFYQWHTFFAEQPRNRINYLLQTLYISCGRPLDTYNHLALRASQRVHPHADILVYLRQNIALENPQL